jgi:hypothetical protein
MTATSWILSEVDAVVADAEHFPNLAASSVLGDDGTLMLVQAKSMVVAEEKQLLRAASVPLGDNTAGLPLGDGARRHCFLARRHLVRRWLHHQKWEGSDIKNYIFGVGRQHPT